MAIPVTAPMLLDSTGQGIIEALEGIANSVQPVNIYLDMEISIPVDGWSETVPHRYQWLNQRVTTECGVEVHFKDGAENVTMNFLEYDKIPGGIQFEIDEIPDAAIPLVVRIINAMADAVIEPVGADLITTSAVPGCANVEEALGDHESRISTNEDAISDLEDDMDNVDDALSKRAQSVNGIQVDPETGDVAVPEVEFAHQIVTDDAQQSTGEFLFRTTGGDASLTDGDAKLISITGRSIHTGKVDESINMTVNMAARQPSEPIIEAVLDRDEFVEAMTESGTLTLTYTSDWNEDPSDYGITVTGTPFSGDEIVVVYMKADRGLITSSNPSSFVSTGWNLYNHTNGYARVKKYSDTYGFLIGGAYSAIQFSATLDGEKETITPASGYFAIPSDGYIWVTGGNNTTTYILMTWSDWGEGYEGDWEAYSETTVSLSAIMANFPNGLMQVGSAADEINFSMKRAISRIEKMEYTEQNLETVIESGRAYDADEDYIYAVRESEVVYIISATGAYTASDHGQEMIIGGTVSVLIQTLYGRNLVDYLRHDIPEQIAALNSNITTWEAVTVGVQANIQTGSTNCYKNKGTSMVDFNAYVTANANVSAYTNLFTGLPAPKIANHNVIIADITAGTTFRGFNLAGNISSHVGLTSGHDYAIVLSYVAS